MTDLFSLVQNQVAVFFLIFIRVSGIFLLTPIYGSRNVPGHVKAAFGLTDIGISWITTTIKRCNPK